MSQARILEWVAIFHGFFPTQGSNLDLLHLLHWQADYHWTTWEARKHENLPLNINNRSYPQPVSNGRRVFKPSDSLTMKKGPQGRNTPLQVPFMGWPPKSHWSTPSPSITCYVLSLGCHHKWWQTDFVAWNDRIPFRPEVHNQSGGRTAFPLKALGENPTSPLPASGDSRCPQLVMTSLSSLLPSFSSASMPCPFLSTLVIGFRTHPHNSGSFHILRSWT